MRITFRCHIAGDDIPMCCSHAGAARAHDGRQRLSTSYASVRPISLASRRSPLSPPRTTVGTRNTNAQSCIYRRTHMQDTVSHRHTRVGIHSVGAVSRRLLAHLMPCGRIGCNPDQAPRHVDTPREVPRATAHTSKYDTTPTKCTPARSEQGEPLRSPEQSIVHRQQSRQHTDTKIKIEAPTSAGTRR